MPTLAEMPVGVGVLGRGVASGSCRLEVSLEAALGVRTSVSGAKLSTLSSSSLSREGGRGTATATSAAQAARAASSNWPQAAGGSRRCVEAEAGGAAGAEGGGEVGPLRRGLGGTSAAGLGMGGEAGGLGRGGRRAPQGALMPCRRRGEVAGEPSRWFEAPQGEGGTISSCPQAAAKPDISRGDALEPCPPCRELTTRRTGTHGRAHGAPATSRSRSGAASALLRWQGRRGGSEAELRRLPAGAAGAAGAGDEAARTSSAQGACEAREGRSRRGSRGVAVPETMRP